MQISIAGETTTVQRELDATTWPSQPYIQYVQKRRAENMQCLSAFLLKGEWSRKSCSQNLNYSLFFLGNDRVRETLSETSGKIIKFENVTKFCHAKRRLFRKPRPNNFFPNNFFPTSFLFLEIFVKIWSFPIFCGSLLFSCSSKKVFKY
jgi:hypothetical protein